MFITLRDKIKTDSTQGERLRYLRSLVGVTRSYICNKYEIPEVTLKSWESASTNLTDNAIKKCVELYLSEGVIVSEDWLKHASGITPSMASEIEGYFSQQNITKTDFISEENDDLSILRDANIFKNSYKNSIIMLVTGNEMQPFYNSGDYVGGINYKIENLEDVNGKDSIVTLENDTQYFRRVFYTPAGEYNLAYINPSISPNYPVLYNVKIKEIAPIIWHRKRKF